MTPESYDLQPVTRITAGSVGSPGKRVFYLQARRDDQLVTLIVEKGQLQSLAVGLEGFLRDLQRRNPDLPAAAGEYRESEMRLEQPLDPAFRVGQLGLGYDEPTDLLILVAKGVQAEGEDPDQAATARFWCTRSQLLSMCQWGLELAGRGRPICGNCGEPIDLEGHFCPKRNGHKR
ncbi:MAG: DUF3090 domain-containing protein [Anaerolineales bacterium]